MSVALTIVLLAAAVLAIGLARLLTHATVERLLDLAGTILAGVVMVAGIITLR